MYEGEIFMFNEAQHFFIFILLTTLVFPMFLSMINWHHVQISICRHIAIHAKRIYDITKEYN